MKYLKANFIPIIIVMVSLAVLASCTHVIKISDIQQLQIVSPLKRISQKKFLVNDFNKTESVSQLIGTNEGHKYLLEQSPALMVSTAIKKELQRNGHICVDNSQLKPDFEIDGTVYKYILTQRISSHPGTEANSTVAVKLTIRNASDEKKIMIKNYEGEYLLDNYRIPTYNTLINVSLQALSALVKEISADPELISFLEK